MPAENRKPAAFPAGHYILGGSGEAARGEDVHEFTKPFQLRSNQYVLSGGPKPTDLIFVDDDLEIFQEKTQLFVDDDHVRTTENRGKHAARYKGEPMVLWSSMPRRRYENCCNRLLYRRKPFLAHSGCTAGAWRTPRS